MNLLILDDDDNVRSSLVKFLHLRGYEAQGVAHPQDAQAILTRHSFDALLLDLRMPDMNGLEFLTWLNQESFLIPVIMISAHGELEDAVQAMKLGARDYLTKPFHPDELLYRIQRLAEEIQLKRNLHTQNLSQIPDKEDNRCFWGSTPEMEQLKQDLRRASLSDATVLLMGESGTGKEITARWIHKQSNRSDQGFLPINLGSLNASLVESELFGHEKGAFTGADQRKSGIFESAQGGTVFLDEIGELPLAVQPKLLRVLQEGTIRRVGNPREFPVDVRVIGATNQNLPEMVQKGLFREDLYYRLNIIPFTIPPLRERKVDIPGLAEVLLANISRRIGKKHLTITSQAMDILKTYEFPGNIRELENLLERWAILSPGSSIQPDIVYRTLAAPGKNQEVQLESMYNLKEQEKNLIQRALAAHGQNRTRTSAALGITRKTLIAKIAEYGL